MSERLRPRDLAILAAESPTTPMHNATVEIFDPGELRLRPRPAGRADRRPDRLRPALPPAAAAGAGPAGQPGLGGRRELRPRLPRTPLRAAAARDRWTSCASSSPASRPGRSTGSRPLWECYFVEGLADGRVALLTKSHQILVDGARPSTSARCCSTPRPDRSTLGHDDDWRPRRTAGPVAAAARRGDGHPRRARAPCGRPPAPTPSRWAARPRPPAPAVAEVANALAGPRPGALHAGAPPALAAAPVRHRAHRARRLPRDPRGARRHRQRRHPGHPRRRRCAAG